MSQSMICSLVLALRSIWRASMFTALPPSGGLTHLSLILRALTVRRQRPLRRVMPQFEFRRSLDGVSFDRNEQIAMAWVMVWKGGQEPPEDKDWVLVELEPTPEPA